MLRDLLTVNIYTLLMIFARLGAAMMLMPVFGNSNIFMRARLLLALAISFLLLPVLGPYVPPMPAQPLSLLLLVLGEVTIGLFFCLVLQALLTPIDLAGNFISYSAGLANAFVFDSSSMQQSQILSSFLSLVGITLVLVTNSHHLMLEGMIGTYDLFRPGAGVPIDDMSSVFVDTLRQTFRIGMSLAAPLVVFSLTFNTALGLINRLVPQMQVFFVGMPLQILCGLFLLGVSLPAIMLWFLRTFSDNLLLFAPAR